MLLINFGHPLTPEHRTKIEELTGQILEKVLDVKVQFDHQLDFKSQVVTLVDAIGLTSEQWQTAKLIINPPTLNIIAVTLLAELHGRMGYFPPVVRLRPVADVVPIEFEVAEIISLQQLRDKARDQR